MEEEDLALNDVEHCEACEIHEDKIKQVTEHMPDEDELYDLAEMLRMNQSAISHQLKILKQAKLVTGRREGKSVIYSLADDHVRTIIDQGREHLEE